MELLRYLLERASGPSAVKRALVLQDLRLRFSRVPEALPSERFLSLSNLRLVREGLRHPKRSVWTSIFAPAEIFHAFGVYPLPMEGLASAAAGVGLAPTLLDLSDRFGVQTHACTYHRALVGLAVRGILPAPLAILPSSHICDHNVKSFELIARLVDRPFFMLDVPNDYGPDAVVYLAEGLRDLVAFLEEQLHERLAPDRLAEALTRSNLGRQQLLEINTLRRRSDCPLRGSRALSFLSPTYLLMGSTEGVEFFRQLRQDLNRESWLTSDRCVRLIWMHLSPREDGPVKAVFDDGQRCRIVFEEINQVYWEPLDIAHPFESLARKLLSNYGVGPLRRRIDRILEMVEDFRADGVVHFCHWGCRQGAGAVGMLAQTLDEAGIPFLSLDGDCVDPRQGSPGQLTTRMEGFLEMIEARGDRSVR